MRNISEFLSFNECFLDSYQMVELVTQLKQLHFLFLLHQLPHPLARPRQPHSLAHRPPPALLDHHLQRILNVFIVGAYYAAL